MFMPSQSVAASAAQPRPVFKNILLATDFSDTSQIALRYAIGLADLYHSKILVVHVTRETSASVETHTSRSMSAYLASAALTSVRYETLIERGEIPPVISGLADKHGIDLVIAGTHERKGAARLLLGSTVEQIFRAVSCPVLTTGPDVDRERPAKGGMKEVVYATDFDPGSLHAWPYALSLAEVYGARLTLVHILSEEIPPYAQEGTEVSFQEQLRRMLPEGRAISSEAVVRLGLPATGILEIAKERDASLIVMGVCGQVSWSATHLPWAVAHQVVCHAHCPVLTVRG
jgi:nucleotide-binding universal stress UspA family protein